MSSYLHVFSSIKLSGRRRRYSDKCIFSIWRKRYIDEDEDKWLLIRRHGWIGGRWFEGVIYVFFFFVKDNFILFYFIIEVKIKDKILERDSVWEQIKDNFKESGNQRVLLS